MSKDKYIVYVDDDEDDRFIFEQSFRKIEDYRFVSVESGEALFHFLERMKEHGFPCLVICDMNMPQKNGVEVLKELRSQEEYIDIPIVMFTTSKNPAEVKQCTELGAEVEVKPADMEEFEDVAERLIKYCRQ